MGWQRKVKPGCLEKPVPSELAALVRAFTKLLSYNNTHPAISSEFGRLSGILETLWKPRAKNQPNIDRFEYEAAERKLNGVAKEFQDTYRNEYKKLLPAESAAAQKDFEELLEKCIGFVNGRVNAL